MSDGTEKRHRKIPPLNTLNAPSWCDPAVSFEEASEGSALLPGGGDGPPLAGRGCPAARRMLMTKALVSLTRMASKNL